MWLSAWSGLKCVECAWWLYNIVMHHADCPGCVWKRHQHHHLSDEGILLWHGACWVAVGWKLEAPWSLGFYQRVYMCADEVGSNWWPAEIQLWLLVRIITRELFNPDGPCGWVLEVAWSVLSVPGDSTTLSCTTPIAPAACGRDMKRHQHHQLSDEGILLWQGACWVLSRVSFDLHFFF